VRALFDVQVMLLGDDSLVSETLAGIRAGNWAPAAWRTSIAAHAQVFDRMDDPYLREHGADIRELGQRVLLHLQARGGPAGGATPQRCILVGETLGLAEIAAVPAPCLAGLVSLRGSALSHMAVLARALGIPAVVSLAHAPGLLDGRELAVDGEAGCVYLDPSPALVAGLRQRADRARIRAEQLRGLRSLPACTPDGIHLPLYANIGLPSDIPAAHASGAEGVGLYRSEYRFLLGETLPVEEEQLRDYRQVLEAFAPRPVTLRTLDVGGDKMLSAFPVEEENPFLGCRGIRFSLDRPEIFLIQLRAMLRANAGLGNLQVLLPMIGTVDELDEALHLLARAERELAAGGLETARPRVGVMIEVPASVFLVGAMAKRVDAFSIGTNDLAQYLLAVDRNNVQVITPYDALHPAVLDAIRQVVETAHRFGKPVGVCGEMAGDPAGALVLLGLGVDALSMSPALLGEVKRTIRCLTRERARQLAEAALAMEDGFAIHRLLHGALDRVQSCSGAD
jgi:phosphotransferase system enzyme I (PtsP)